MNTGKWLILGLFTIIILRQSVFGCTTAIVSGKNTVDGRPLLLKQRDTGKLDNKLMYFSDGKYEYIGLVNAVDSLGKEVWAGANSAGFAIMNSASYNLKRNDTTSLKDQEGVLMKRALQSCASLEDFEELLRELPKPLGIEANFGVIDGRGGAAYYETDNFNYTKFDANDPKVAPFGYLIRTNFSYTGDAAKGLGLIRYQTAEELFRQAAIEGKLSATFLLRDVSRSLKQTLTKRDLYEKMPADSEDTKIIPFRDFIPRYSTAAAMVVQGVKKGESAALTTIWTVLGFPLTSVVVPVWVSAKGQLPKLLMAGPAGKAPMCEKAMELKKRLFPLKRGSNKSYLDLSKLINREKSGILQQLVPLDKEVMKKAKRYLTEWRNKKAVSPKQVRSFNQWVDSFLLEEYIKAF